MGLDFADNSTDVIDHGSGSSLDDLDPFTVMMWLYPQTTNNNRILFSKDVFDKVLRQSGGLGALQGLVGRATTDSSFITNDSPSPLVDNTWSFVAWTFDSSAGAGEVQNIYHGRLDSLAIESTYGTATDGSGALTSDASGTLKIGGRGITSTDGIFAVAAYCNVALTLAQIQDWQFRPRKLASMVMYAQYHGTGTQPVLSGNGNNGTVTGAVAADHVPLGPPFGFDYGWAGNVTILTVTLPTAVGISGQTVAVKNVTDTVAPIVVSSISGQTIDGAASVTVITARGKVQFISDGSNWMQVI